MMEERGEKVKEEITREETWFEMEEEEMSAFFSQRNKIKR